MYIYKGNKTGNDDKSLKTYTAKLRGNGGYDHIQLTLPLEFT